MTYNVFGGTLSLTQSTILHMTIAHVYRIKFKNSVITSSSRQKKKMVVTLIYIIIDGKKT